MAILRDVTTKWVRHTTPDAYGKLTITVILNSEQELDLVDMGLPIKTKDGECYYTFSCNPVNQKGEEVIIPVYDRYGQPFKGKVPNGTKMDIDFYTYQWEFSGKSGVKGRIGGAKVLGDVQPDTALEFDIPEVD